MIPRVANQTPDPIILERLRVLRDDAVEPVVPSKQEDPVKNEPITVPLVVKVGIETVAPMLDEQARRLFNGFAKVYVESGVHGQTIIYVLDLFRAALITKEGTRLGIHGVAKE